MPKHTAPPHDPNRLGPADHAGIATRQEAKRALVWVAVVGLAALTVVLADPLMVVFGGIVFGTLIDGGARLIGKVAPLPRILRVALVLVAAVAFLGWFVVYAGGQITDQAAQLPGMISASATKAMHFAAKHGLVMTKATDQNLVNQALSSVGQLGGLVGGLIGGATTLFLVLVLGVYFAIDPHPYRRGLAWMLPRERREYFEATFADMGHALRRLLFGRLIGMAVEGVTVGMALGFRGVPLASILGLIAGLLAFLPNIGAPISGLLMILVGFSGGTQMGLYCIAVYVIVQGIDGYVIVPLVAKRTAELAPALVMAMQLIMGVLFGIIGIALADPLLAMIKVMLEHLAGGGSEAGADEAEALAEA